YAADQIIAIDGDIERINRRANAYVSAQQQPRMPADFAGLTPEQARLAVKCGLSGAEAEIALKATGDKRLDDADRMQMYAEGKAKYRDWRANPANWDETDIQKGYKR